ncbi:MAG: rhodanese-like domain-containing protein [Candidatus Cloacimonetes bacterium]|nr:rhodanese-like domain-containing protein [Candidatus Cloacimonadota bacterium]
MFLSSSQTKKIKIHNTQEDTMYISFVNDFDDIEIKIEPAILYPANYGELIVHFNPENRNFGKISDMILLNIKFANKQHLGELIFNANIIEDFSALTPAEKANPPIISVDNKTLNLKDLNPEELRTEVIEIENKGTRDLYIRNIQTSDEGFSIVPSKFVVGPGKKKSFNITVTPNHGVSKIKSIITIISNDPEHSIIGFTIIAKVNQPAEVSSKNMLNEINIKIANSILQNSKGENDLVILDIRTEDEYNNGCIEDAVNINFYDSNFKKIIKLMDKQKTYLVYCQSGIRSKKAVELMSKMGFRKIYHMHEGIEGWKAQRLKLIDPDK